jgi:hypothetical protein
MSTAVTVPLAEVGPGVHVLGHIGLTEEGYSLLTEALADQALNARADKAAKLLEIKAGLCSD